MTPTEFVIWLKGFVQAAPNFTITPQQWDDLREQLDKVKIEETNKWTRYTLDDSNWNTNSTQNIKND